MKMTLLFLCSLLLCGFSSCSVKYAPPKTERCIHNDDNSAECADLRRKPEEQVYTREDLTNYICTNPKDEGLLYNYCSDMRSKLIQCEARLSQCGNSP